MAASILVSRGIWAMSDRFLSNSRINMSHKFMEFMENQIMGFQEVQKGSDFTHARLTNHYELFFKWSSEMMCLFEDIITKDRMKVEEFLKPLVADFSLVSHAKFDSVWTLSFLCLFESLGSGLCQTFFWLIRGS